MGTVEKLDSSPLYPSLPPFLSPPLLPFPSPSLFFPFPPLLSLLSLPLLSLTFPSSSSSYHLLPISSFSHSLQAAFPPRSRASVLLSVQSFIHLLPIYPSTLPYVHSPIHTSVHLSFHLPIYFDHLTFCRPRACSGGTLIFPSKPFQNLLADSCPKACSKWDYGTPLDETAASLLSEPSDASSESRVCNMHAHTHTRPVATEGR